MSIIAAMCEYMYYDIQRKQRAKKLAEPEPEPKTEEKPIVVKA